MQKLNEFEKALVTALVRDDGSPPPTRPPEIDALQVEKRSMTGSGFITELRDTAESRVYRDDVSLRWGAQFVALVNETEQVGMVVYVDQGRIATLEAYTFGGRAWPAEIHDFKLERLQGTTATPAGS